MTGPKKSFQGLKPQAGYVAPDVPEEIPDLTDEELEQLEEQRAASLQAIGTSFGDDSESSAWDFDDWDISTEIEKAVAPIYEAAEHADFVKNTSHDATQASVEIESSSGSSGNATSELLLAVWCKVKGGKKQPKAEVIAKVVGLVVAKVRNESGLKHPRDLAKEVKVRPKTFFAMLKIAEEEVERLNLAERLKTGT